MSADRDTQDVDRLLDAALASYPLRPLPAGFVERTMARATAGTGARLRPQALDLALPLLVPLLAALAVLGLYALPARLDPLWLPRLRLLWQGVELELAAWLPAGTSLPAGLTTGVAVALGAALLAAVMLLDRPRLAPGR
jgi:hypothetical protein